MQLMEDLEKFTTYYKFVVIGISESENLKFLKSIGEEADQT